MSVREVRTLLSTETECLTVWDPEGDSTETEAAVREFLQMMAQLAPSLPGRHGFFNAYGRVYLDGAHLELAAAECADPFLLVQVIEAQQMLASQAAERIRLHGRKLILANCNHSGLLQDHSPTWGSHGNYLVREHPSLLAERLLPFLVTRLYAGAGGVHWPSGTVFAGVRSQFLQLDSGGDTMHLRAIHSTARDEPLTRYPEHYGWRYHTLLGDGLRSHFGLLLRFGVTALVLHAVTALPHGLELLPTPKGIQWKPSFWVQSLRHFNRLERKEAGLHASPVAVEVQRVYLQLVDRWLNSLEDAPAWMRQVLTIWETTLDALARNDQSWLASRLDPWIKYRLFQEFLEFHGKTWDDQKTDLELACGLALLNQNYHEIINPESCFLRMDVSGMLCHRIGPQLRPGEEPEPFVPDLGTRATPRARFLRDQQNQTNYLMDWNQVVDFEERQICSLENPFAQTVHAED